MSICLRVIGVRRANLVPSMLLISLLCKEPTFHILISYTICIIPYQYFIEGVNANVGAPPGIAKCRRAAAAFVRN
jgi:hypothetical protein